MPAKMVQSDPISARSESTSSSDSDKKHKSKRARSPSRSKNGKKRKSTHQSTTVEDEHNSHVARRSSLSKPGRDELDALRVVKKKKNDSPFIDFDGLSRPSRGTRERLEESAEKKAERLDRMRGAVRTLLSCVGEDPDREGLLATPDRYAKALLTFTQGYEQNVMDIVNGAIFQEDHSEMVIVKDINVESLCEHHLVPFTGKMHIGYIPRNTVIGISKLPRIAEMFARRLQIQERLTKEVANAIFEVLKPQGVAVVMESSHLCMVMRGVQKVNSTTMTSCVLGCFERKQKTRNEFMSLIGVNRNS